MNAFGIILPIVYIIVGCALVWFVIELALTVRRARTTVVELKSDLDPAIENVNKLLEDAKPAVENVNKMLEDAKPAVEKIDPLVDRVTLTVDSANLEIMRLDEIMGDVTKITNGVSKAVGAVDTVTNAPLDLVTSMTKKVRSKFRPKYASDESVDLGNEKTDEKPVNPIVDFVDTAGSAASEAIKEQADKRSKQKAVKEEQAMNTEARNEKMNASSQKIADSVLDYVDIDTLKE